MFPSHVPTLRFAERLDVHFQIEMNFAKPGLFHIGNQISFVKIHHRVRIEGLEALIDCLDLRGDLHDGRCVESRKNVRRLLAESIDRLEERQSSSRLEDAMELPDSLLFIRNVDQDGTCGDGINAGIL
jgi:hypothetical protein